MQSIREMLERGQMPLPTNGGLRRQDPPLLPWSVVDDAGREIEPLVSFLRDLALSDSSPLMLRSYGYDLLRWWRLLSVVEVDWKQATRADVEVLVGWLRTSPNPQRRGTPGSAPADTVHPRTGKTTLRAGYSAGTINHALTVISGFYAFHAYFGRGPASNPVPASGRGRLLAHHAPDLPMDPHGRAPLRQRQQERRPRPLPALQWIDLLDAMTCHRDRALLAFYASSGARASELLGVTADKIDGRHSSSGLSRRGAACWKRCQGRRKRSPTSLSISTRWGRPAAVNRCGGLAAGTVGR